MFCTCKVMHRGLESSNLCRLAQPSVNRRCHALFLACFAVHPMSIIWHIDIHVRIYNVERKLYIIYNMQILYTWWTHSYKQVSAIGVTPQDIRVITITLTEAPFTTLVSWMTGPHSQDKVCWFRITLCKHDMQCKGLLLASRRAKAECMNKTYWRVCCV